MSEGSNKDKGGRSDLHWAGTEHVSVGNHIPLPSAVPEEPGFKLDFGAENNENSKSSHLLSCHTLS